MVRELKYLVAGDRGDGGSSAVLVFIWGVLVTIFVFSTIIFSCGEGASKDKDTVDPTVYGGGCTAGCGAACGG